MVATNPAGMLQAPVSHTLVSNPIDGVFLTHDGTTAGIFVTFNNGAEGAFYTFDGAGNPVFEQSVVAPADSTLSGLLAYKPGRVSLLLANDGSTISTRMQDYQYSGGSWNPGAITNLPTTGIRASLTNVLIYNKEPLVNPSAVLVESLQVPDWSSSFSVDGAGNVTVDAELFGGEVSGLETPTPTAIGSSPVAAATTYGLTNQYSPVIAIDSGQTVFGSYATLC